MPEDRPVFYLDGFDGQTTKNLRLKGFLDREMFTANIFANTAAVLKVRMYKLSLASLYNE
jgi:hypothetical protein